MAVHELKPGVMGLQTPNASGQWRLYDPLSGTRASASTVEVGAEDAGQSRVVASLEAHPVAGGDNPDTVLAHYFEDARSRPPAWNVELSDRCTLSCRHCYQRPVRCNPWDVGPCEIASQHELLVERVLASGASEVSLSGGEVLLSGALEDLLTTLRSADASLRIRVLLTGLAAQRRRRLRRLLPMLGELGVSASVPIYSYREATHDWVTRSPGSLQDTLSLIEMLQQEGVELRVAFLILRRSVAEAVETVSFLQGLVGSRFVVSSLVYPPRRGTDDGGPYRLEPDDLRQLIRSECFAALPAEYLSFQPRCTFGCRFPTVDSAGETRGCAIHSGSTCGGALSDAKAVPLAAHWAPSDDGCADPAVCGDCGVRAFCKRCLAFHASPRSLPEYCALVRVCAETVRIRVNSAKEEGMDFLHPTVRKWSGVASEATAPPDECRDKGDQPCP